MASTTMRAAWTMSVRVPASEKAMINAADLPKGDQASP
jgi:hypothetical protein